MNNTFRRQPMTINAPTDDSRLWHINNFKGVQQLENPLVADPNSAYDALNVYRNDTGNLTVRPRLETSGKSIINESKDILGFWEYDGRYFWYTADALKTDGASLAIDGTRGCTMQIYKDIPYFLIATPSLQLFKYTDTFIRVDGYLPITDDNKNINYYNILSPSIQSGTVAELKDLPEINTISNESNTTTTKVLATIENISRVDDNTATTTEDIITNLQKVSDNCYFLINRPVFGTSTTDNIQINVQIFYKVALSWKRTTYTFDYTWRSITGFTYTTANNMLTLYLTTDASIKEASEYLYPKHYDVTVPLITITIDLFNLQPPDININNKHAIAKIDISDSITLRDYIVKVAGLYNDWIVYMVRGWSGSVYYYALDYIRISETTAVRQLKTDYAYNWNYLVSKNISNQLPLSNGIAYISRDNDKYVISSVLYYGSYGMTLVNKNYTPNFTDTVFQQAMITNTVSTILIDGTIHELKEWSSAYTKIITEDYDKLNDISKILSVSSEYITATNGSLIYQINRIHLSQLYAWSSTDNILDIWHTYYGSELSTIIDLSELKIKQYIYNVIGNLTSRPLDTVPLLNNLNANIITSFFLDNTYWFITDKYIFGTDRDTIEFWSYTKYFELANLVNAAIRISDISFWVFSGSGAYLIYKSTTSGDVTSLGQQHWRITQTAQFNSCGFKNAVSTLPSVGTTIAAITLVTNQDISYVTMRKYMQTDERIVQAITLKIANYIQQIIKSASDVKIVSYKYLTLYAFNLEDKCKIVVFDAQYNEWWIWQFPVDKIYQFTKTKDNIDILLRIDDNTYGIFNLAETEINFKLGARDFEVYADIIGDPDEYSSIKPIDWHWTSALTSFGSLDFRKQLLQTMFTFTDLGEDSNTNCEYSFEVYRKNFVKTSDTNIQTDVKLAKNKYQRTYIATYNFLQLRLQNVTRKEYYEPGEILEICTKPKLTSITMKYRYLPGIGAK